MADTVNISAPIPDCWSLLCIAGFPVDLKAVISTAFRSSLDEIKSDKRDVYVAFPRTERVSITKPSFAENVIFQIHRQWQKVIIQTPFLARTTCCAIL